MPNTVSSLSLLTALRKRIGDDLECECEDCKQEQWNLGEELSRRAKADRREYECLERASKFHTAKETQTKDKNQSVERTRRDIHQMYGRIFGTSTWLNDSI